MSLGIENAVIDLIEETEPAVYGGRGEIKSETQIPVFWNEKVSNINSFFKRGNAERINAVATFVFDTTGVTPKTEGFKVRYNNKIYRIDAIDNLNFGSIVTGTYKLYLIEESDA